jgi:hypothetical protein
MRRLFILIWFLACCVSRSHAQYPTLDWPSYEPPPFEVYALASGVGTVDPTSPSTVIIHNPVPGQDLGFTPSGFASGARVGFVWRHDKLGLVADFGFHKYADRARSTSIAPLMLGLRVYSEEHFRTSFFGEGLAGAYRWTDRAQNANFVTVKGIVAVGGGMDIRLTRRVVFRVGEIQLMIAGGAAELTGSTSSGLVFRF